MRVVVPPALLFPELERDKFSLELPESPRLTLTDDNVDPGVLRSDPLVLRLRLSAVLRERT